MSNEPEYEFESFCEVQEYDSADPYRLNVHLLGKKEGDEVQHLVMRQIPHLDMEAGRVFKVTVKMERLPDALADEVKKRSIYWMGFQLAVQRIEAGELAAKILTTNALDNPDDEAFYTWTKDSPYHVHQLVVPNSEGARTVVYFLSKEPHLTDDRLKDWLGW